jgi:hypothetical protein
MEALYFQKYGIHIKLSERDVFVCSGGSCDQGNTMEAPFDYARDVGVATEECCPYGDTINGADHSCGDGKCGTWWVDGVKIASWWKLTNQTEIDTAIREGPVCMSMAVPQSFMNYAGGVYHSLGAFDPIKGYHAIGCFGKNFTEGWIELRNSWGAQGWGEKSLSDHITGEEGWARVKADDAALELEYYKVIINGPIPEPQPTPSDCTRGAKVAVVLTAMMATESVGKILNAAMDTIGAIGKILHIKWLRRRGRFYFVQGSFYYLNPPNV